MKSNIIRLCAYLWIIIFLFANTGLCASYSSDIDKKLIKNFRTPPLGYGEVAFYWWLGDSLKKERLLDQLDKLKGFKISSLQINYAHDDYRDKVTGARPHYKSIPDVMSDEWWSLVNWFTKEANKRGMSVSLSDYCLGIGQKSYFDEALNKYPDVAGYLLKYDSIKVCDKLEWKLPENVVSLSAFPLDESGQIIPDSLRDLRNMVCGGKINCDLKSDWIVYVVFAEKQSWSYDPMHQLSGKGILECFYSEFDKHIPNQMGKGLNFFFSDELNFKLKGKVWNKNFSSEFYKRKGYDVCPELIALWKDIGKRTAKIRMDYNDIYVSLSEENYFKPIYDYNEKYGMILGCDHGGRGYILDEFGDYFRTQRWNQGPGSDQPFLEKSIIKAKVASSISHMYERPRVWLEGFYGSGWSTNTAALTDALYSNLTLGYNLLTLHGLYYTTYGRWWEWAPPCNHFRMPYWDHMRSFLETSERLCYLLSQGKHVADIAVLYPVEAIVADQLKGNESVKTAFATGELLYKNGIDFDFMDYESLHRASVQNERINVSGESFSIIIIPSMKAISHKSLLKLIEFANNGGIVLNIGNLPEATELQGKTDYINDLVKKMLNNENVYCLNRYDDVLSVIDKTIIRDFRCDNISCTQDKFTYIHHRKIGSRDVYAVYGVPAGNICFFRKKGHVELWDPVTARTSELTRVHEVNDGTCVEMPLTENEIQIIVFSPKDVITTKTSYSYCSNPIEEIDLGKEWQSEIVPVLDNKWGDYYLPESDELVGPWVEQMFYFTPEYMLEDSNHGEYITYSYGPQFYQAGPFNNPIPVECSDSLFAEKDKCKEYRFSWRYGVEGDCGRQGYHGLKGKIHNEFIRIGELSVPSNSGSMIRKGQEGKYNYLYSFVNAPYTGNYRILTGNVLPNGLYVDGHKCIVSDEIFLESGIHKLVLEYKGACSTYFLLQKQNDSYENPVKLPLSMQWYLDKSLLKYSVYPNKNNIGEYRFKCAPGLDSLSFAMHGDDIQLYIGNKKIPDVKKVGTTNDGADIFVCKLKNPILSSESVSIKIKHRWGYYGGAALSMPIKQYCKNGNISVGDWSCIDGLKNYSGGIKYIKNVNLDSKYKGKTIVLDLKNIVSTAEVLVNGKSVGIRFSRPWTFDLTRYLMPGSNKIEIMIYNTLGNIYSTIPTIYSKNTVSGLLEEPALLVY